METASGRGSDDEVSVEIARLRDAVEDLRRRPSALDADTLRHVVTASLNEASAPPPNLLVTAIRRLDRLDARLESIEATLAGPGALPRGATGGAGGGAAMLAPTPLSSPGPPLDTEAIAEALVRRLGGGAPLQGQPSGAGGARTEDLVRALRPLVPAAARAVLRRSGREPSQQAVEVLQQTALMALEEAVESLATFAPATSAVSATTGSGWPPHPEALASPPPPSLPPAPAPPPPPAPAPLDVDALAATVAAQVALALAPTRPGPAGEPVPRRPEPHQPPPPPLDPDGVAEAVIARLGRQPPAQAVLSPVAMAPLLGAVGNVEAAVARLARPEADVMVAVGRLGAGVEALARALEEDRTFQADELRRGFERVGDLVRVDLGSRPPTSQPGDGGGSDAADDETEVDGAGAGVPVELRPLATAVAALRRRLDQLAWQLAPLVQADLGATVATVAARGERLEGSVAEVLTAVGNLAQEMHEQSSVWSTGFDRLAAGSEPEVPADATRLTAFGSELTRRLDQLAAGTAADRQRFERLGGTIGGLATLLGRVSERLDHLTVEDRSAPRPRPSGTGGTSGGPAGTPPGPAAGDRSGTPGLPARTPPDADAGQPLRPEDPSARPADTGGNRDARSAGAPGAAGRSRRRRRVGGPRGSRRG